MEKGESFNRTKHGHEIEPETFTWEGPFSWPWAEEKIEGIPSVKDSVSTEDVGVYLFTFECENKNGYLPYWAGQGQILKRLKDHDKKFKTGQYDILDVTSASRGERVELWEGWPTAQEPPKWIRESQTIIEIEKKLGPLENDKIKDIWNNYEKMKNPKNKSYEKFYDINDILKKRFGKKDRREEEYEKKFKTKIEEERKIHQKSC